MSSTLTVTNLTATNLTDGAGTTSAFANINSGSVKAWCNVNQTSTQAIRDSFNVTSITDVGTGATAITFTSSMSSGDYGFTACRGRTSAQNGNIIAQTNVAVPTASVIRVVCYKENFTTIDDEFANIAINGDLA